MERHLTSKKNGYVLIEAMVALGVLTSSVLGIFALMSQSIKLTRIIDDQYVGTYLAAEGIEITKNILDANFPPLGAGAWNAGGFDASACYEIDVNTIDLSAATPVGCPAGSSRVLSLDNATPLYSYGAGSASGFSRTVRIAPVMDETNTAQEGVRVVSTVKWANNESSVTLEDKFYDWHQP